MPRTFTRDDSGGAGTWKPIYRGSKPPSASICCPSCERYGSLLDHTIADDGTVAPSLVCPHEPCEFHEFGKLEGWPP